AHGPSCSIHTPPGSRRGLRRGCIILLLVGDGYTGTVCAVVAHRLRRYYRTSVVCCRIQEIRIAPTQIIHFVVWNTGFVADSRCTRLLQRRFSACGARFCVFNSFWTNGEIGELPVLFEIGRCTEEAVICCCERKAEEGKEEVGHGLH
ncbi:hypothetical protein PFISCL1PPCAC_8082, partial [Pristionchus fissidentatus]